MAICPNNRRDAQTLYELISEYVELSSTIHGYNGLLAGSFALPEFRLPDNLRAYE